MMLAGGGSLTWLSNIRGSIVIFMDYLLYYIINIYKRGQASTKEVMLDHTDRPGRLSILDKGFQSGNFLQLRPPCPSDSSPLEIRKYLSWLFLVETLDISFSPGINNILLTDLQHKALVNISHCCLSATVERGDNCSPVIDCELTAIGRDCVRIGLAVTR